MELGYIYALLAAISWGLIYTLDQKILTNVSPLILLFIHSALFACMMIPFIFFNAIHIKNVLTIEKSTWVLILICAVLVAIANFFSLTSIKNLGASTASIIEIAYPFFIVLFSFIIFRSTPNIYFFLGGILIFIGSAIIIKCT